MHIEVSNALDFGESEIELWRSFQRDDERLSSAYLCPELAVVQARHNPALRVAVLTDDNNIVGFVPFTRKSRSVAHVRMVMAAPDFQWNARELMAGCGADVFEFDYLVGHQVEAFQPHHFELQPAATVDLSRGWESWIKEKRAASSQIKRFERKFRNLGRDLGSAEFELQSASHADLDLLMKWKSDQLVLTGRVDRFADPAYRAQFHELLDTSSEHFGIHLSCLRAGDRTLGIHFSAVSQHVVSAWHTGHDPDAELDKYSPGMVLMMQHMESVASKGFTKIDYGKGHTRYKELFKNYDEYVAEGWAERPSVAAYARRARKAPERLALRIVLGNPRLRVAARESLNRLGGIRAKLQGR